MKHTSRLTATIRVYPGGAMILHYTAADYVRVATAGLVPVER